MAFLIDQNPKGPEPVTGPTQNQQAPIAAGGAGVGGSAKPSGQTPGQNVPAQPSAQLSAYLGANQPQAAAFGQNVAQTVGGQVNAAGQAIQPAVNTYTGSLYTVPTDTAVNKAVETSPSSLTPEQQSTYKQELGAAAKAPNSANTFEASPQYQGLAGGVQKAVEQADLWNSGNNVANLSTALAPFEGANATAGDKTLDSLLLSRTPGAYNQIKTAVAPAAGLQGQLSAGTNTADTALQNAIQQDLAATPAAEGAAKNYTTNLTNYLTSGVNAAQTTANTGNAANARIQTDAAAGNLTAEDAQALGIPADQAAAFAAAYDKIGSTINSENALYANPTRAIGLKVPTMNLNQYLTPGTAGSDINAATLATPQNYSDVAALQALLGNGNGTFPISPENAALAGTANLGTSPSYNNAGASGDLSKELTAANQYKSQLEYELAVDPPQNPQQGAVTAQAYSNINNIISYLTTLLGGTNPGGSGNLRTTV